MDCCGHHRASDSGLRAIAENACCSELDALAHGVNVLSSELRFRMRELQNAQASLIQSGKLAALGEVSVDQFHRGDIITFIDSEMNVIDTGMVIKITSDQVHVRYDLPDAAHRQPRVGDLGVLVPKH